MGECPAEDAPWATTEAKQGFSHSGFFLRTCARPNRRAASAASGASPAKAAPIPQRETSALRVSIEPRLPVSLEWRALVTGQRVAYASPD